MLNIAICDDDVIYAFGCLSCKTEKHKLLQCVCVAILQIIYIFASNYVTSYEGFMILLHMLYSVILCRIFFRNSWMELIIICITGDVILTLINMLITIVFANEIQFVEAVGFEKNRLRVILLAISKGAYFIATTIFMRIRKKARYKFNVWETIGIVVVFVISVIIVVFSYNSVLNQVGGNFVDGFLWVCISLVLLNIILYLLFIKLGKVNAQRVEEQISKIHLKSQLEMHRDINEVYHETMSVRHELNNLLVGIGILLKEEKYSEAKKRIENILGNEIFNTQKVVFTGKELLDTVINIRLRRCYDKKIRVKVALYGKINQYDEDDMAIVFANLFDNAIKAASKCKEPYIELLSNDEGAYYSIFVKNTLALQEDELELKNGVLAKDINKLKEKLYHGFGLKNVQKIVDNYNGHMINKSTDTHYAVQILLPINNNEGV